MSRSFLFLFGFLCSIFIKSHGATYYTRSSGNISGNIWGTTTTGTGGALPALADGDIIYIDDNVTVGPGNERWDNFDLTIYVNSTVSVSGQWWLSETTIVVLQSASAHINGTGPGNSERIKFGNDNTWTGGDPNLTGPGQLDQNYNSGIGLGPLPVKLIFFKANQSGENVFLSWATASEKNFEYFSIERSANGMDFSEIEQVKGHGTTIEKKDYKLVDNSPLIGRNYYRLKSVDFDGYTEYFNVVLVNFSGEKTFSVFPNPSDGTAVNFALNFVPEGNTTITIFDNYNSNIAIVKPTDHWQSVTFANSLKSGLYFARIVSKDFVRVERFVVK